MKKFTKPSSIQGIGESGTTIVGECINVKIIISGETTYVSSIKVVNSSQVPMLLGMDWLIPAQIILDLRRASLKEFLNGKETQLVGVGRSCLPTTNHFVEPLPNKSIYLGPQEATNVTLYFPDRPRFYKER